MKFQLKLFLSLCIICSNITTGISQRITMTDFGVAFHFGAHNKVASFGEELLLRPSIRKNKIQQLNITTKLGVSYAYLGDYNRGLEHLEWAIKNSNQEAEQLPYKIKAYYQTGTIHLKLQQHNLAQLAFTAVLDWYQKRPTIFKQDTSLLKTHIQSLMGIAQTTFHHKSYTQSKSFSFEAIQLIHQYTQDTALLAQSNLDISKALSGIGDFNLAQFYLEQTLALAQAVKQKKELDWVYFYENISNYYLQNQELDKALFYNKKAVQILFPNTKGDNLPSTEEIEYTNLPTTSTTIVAQRAMIQSAHHDLKNLSASIESYQLLDKLIYYLKRTYADPSAQLFWSQKSLKYYTKAIQAALKLHQKTNEDQYKNLAFEFSEKSKSSILLGVFQRAKAQKIANVPNDVLQQETTYRQDYEELRSQVNTLRQKERLSEQEKEKLQTLNSNLQLKKQVYEDYLIKIKKSYPEYYQLKFAVKVVDVPTIQQEIETNQLVIEYFIGEKELIIFRIGKYKFDIFREKIKTDLATDISLFRESIYNYFLKTKRVDPLKKDQYLKQYNELGHKLYNVLLAPVLKDVSEERLTIIVTGHLGLLPFEALLTQPYQSDNFKKAPYLVKDYAVSYCYSASLLKEMKDKPHRAEKIFLGFAPEFDSKVLIEGKYKFDPLEHSRTEVTNIFSTVDMMGEVFDGPTATKKNFKEKCQDYCVVHIATHGGINNKNSEASFLAFSEVKDSNDNELLYVKELYNMNMTAELVVLSACETSVGKLQESEGIASLARGFSYAGAKSIITSLWAVNDFATAEIMQQLYKNLKNGMPKDKALQVAKIYLINSASKEAAHPFLWSAFIQIGDQSPLPMPEVEKKEGSFILAIFGMMHWIFIGIIIIVVLLAGIQLLFPKEEGDS